MNTIFWYQLPHESEAERIDRLNRSLHRIFFDYKEVCPPEFLTTSFDGSCCCLLCETRFDYGSTLHGTPRFLQSLDAMRLIVESGKFAEVREEFFHWLVSEGKPAYECNIMLYRRISDRIYFKETGNSRQEAFCLAALRAVGYEVIREERQGNQ